MNTSPHLALRRSCGLVAVAVLLVLLAPGTADGQEAESPAVVASVQVAEGLASPLAVATYGVVPDPEPTLVVTFAEPFELPDVFRYRVDLHVGQPDSEHQRISFVAESGVPTGAVEVGAGSDWESTGAVPVDFASGVLRMGLPEDLRDVDGDVAWIEAAVVEDEGGAATVATTPLVPASDLILHRGPIVAAAPSAWGSVEQQPPLPPVDTGAAPEMRIDGDEIVITYGAPVPTEVAGSPVFRVVDVVRITPAMGPDVAPYLLAVDHAAETVSLLDGTNPLPLDVSGDGAWLIEGLPPAGVEDGSVIKASLSAVLEAFDIGVADPAADPDLGLGIARSVTLEDSTDDGIANGQVFQADGVIAAAPWLAAAVEDAGSSTTISSTSEPDRPAAGAGGEAKGRRRLVGPSVIIASVIALLGIGLFLLLRWVEHRRHTAAMGPPAAPRPVAPPSPEEQAMLEDFSRQLFDGER